MKKIITILSLVLCLITTAFTQAGPQSIWASVTSSGATASEVEVIEVKEASSGNIYVLVQSNDGTNDIVQLIKYNAVGVEQFSQTYASTAYERPIGMGLDNSENIYIVTDRGINNAKVLKYNSAGNLQWSYMYGGAITLIEPRAMLVNEATGDVYFTGSYENMTNSENENVMLAKLNSAGISQWISYFNSSIDGEDIGYSIVKDNSDNIYVGAKIYSSPIVLKFNASGTQQWQ
ncbi:MAG: hypothetical protein JKY54_10010, partial [Flavobacteriales bacterium]|nr:hypothetical protein [Flavobacteriales bacterium]